MKISRIVIDNYKSIQHIDINLSEKVNALIGENSVGKSNILSALEHGISTSKQIMNKTTGI